MVWGTAVGAEVATSARGGVELASRASIPKSAWSVFGACLLVRRSKAGGAKTPMSRVGGGWLSINAHFALGITSRIVVKVVAGLVSSEAVWNKQL